MSRQLNYRGGGSISMRKDGRWQARLQVNGVRMTLYATSEKEARKKLAELQRQAGGGTWSNPGTRTVDDLLSLWLEAAGPGLKVTTMAWYTAIAAKHIRPNLGRTRINKLEADHLQRLYATLSGRTAQAVHRILHRACRLGVMWRWMDANPTERVLPPTYRAPRKDVWTLEELGRFLEGTAEHWLSPLWTTALVSGCRIGELLCLRWTDADLEAATIRIRGNLQRVKSQGWCPRPRPRPAIGRSRCRQKALPRCAARKYSRQSGG